MQNKKKKLKRLFIAIQLSEESVSILDRYIENSRLLSELKSVNWTPIKNLHITVLFLGNVEEEFIPTIEYIMKEALKTTNPFTLSFDKITFFPDRYPRMIWTEYKINPDFTNLVSILQKALEEILDLKKGDRENIPHVTLARIKHLREVIDLKQVELPSFNVVECFLMESDLSHDKPVYTILSKFSLGNYA